MSQETCHWECEACARVGDIEHDAHADVYSVINLLRQSHDLMSPKCESGISLMRVSKGNAAGRGRRETKTMSDEAEKVVDARIGLAKRADAIRKGPLPIPALAELMDHLAMEADDSFAIEADEKLHKMGTGDAD